MEENATKAIMIGAATFITIITITAVLTYYNTAREMVQSIGAGYDFDATYSEYVRDILLRTDVNSFVTGTDVINILNYFYDDKTVSVKLSNLLPLGVSYTIDSNVPNGISRVTKDDVNTLSLSDFNSIKSSINPNAYFKLERKTENNILKIALTQENK